MLWVGHRLIQIIRTTLLAVFIMNVPSAIDPPNLHTLLYPKKSVMLYLCGTLIIILVCVACFLILWPPMNLKDLTKLLKISPIENSERLAIPLEYFTHFEISPCIDSDGIHYVCTTNATVRTSLIKYFRNIECRSCILFWNTKWIICIIKRWR